VSYSKTLFIILHKLIYWELLHLLLQEYPTAMLNCLYIVTNHRHRELRKGT